MLESTKFLAVGWDDVEKTERKERELEEQKANFVCISILLIR